jgi:alpha-ketoglutaric semialdehyde dehydrogenase
VSDVLAPISTAPVLIAGQWRKSNATETIQAENPARGESLPEAYPVSPWEEALQAIEAGVAAAEILERTPGAEIAVFIEAYAAEIEARGDALAERAHEETGLPAAPRLRNVELPRTTDQLRQAAAAARGETWRRPIHDEAKNIHSTFAPLGGPVVVMGPNNFPFAFNSVAGGDFAAALVAHNPVIAKANPGHPGTTRLLAEAAHEALKRTGLPPATVQMVYHLRNEDGLKLVSHPLTAATAFTGSRAAGMKLKAAAEAAGKLIYLEMSSVNPVVVLAEALRERMTGIAEEFFNSCTLGTGQFCTNPGLVIVPDTQEGRAFIEIAKQKFEVAPAGILLGGGVRDTAKEGVARLQKFGAKLLCGGDVAQGPAYRFQNTLLTVTGEDFLKHPYDLQTEVFGPSSLIVKSAGTEQTAAILRHVEGSLTGTIYFSTEDAEDYAAIEPVLRRRVGRLIGNRMPTGVAVSPAMNHGGPYPATGHPGFTAVGLPVSAQRFAALHCYENLPAEMLPEVLRQ